MSPGGVPAILRNMKKQSAIFRRSLVSIICIFTAAALFARGAGEPSGVAGSAAAEAEAATPLMELRIGLMPAVDSAPMYLAAHRGYFSAEGLDVEITLFTSGQDRQSALQTGQVDGAMTDLVALAVNNDAGFELRAPMLTDGVFPVLVRAGSEDRDVLQVGLMEVSVTNFLVDSWLAGDYELEKTYVNAIPVRLEAVLAGRLDAGIFPEPFASIGEARGLEKWLFEAPGGFSPDVMAFTSAALGGRREAIGAFIRAYNRAVADINQDPSLARDMLIEYIPNLPPQLRDNIILPSYHPARLPDGAYLQSIIDWTSGILGRNLNVTPGDLIAPELLEGAERN